MAVLLTALLVVCIGVAPSIALESDCCVCHGDSETVHGSYNHTAIPGSGSVVVFADTDHDSAAWGGVSPYYDVLVNCTICHNTDLPTIHGNDCSTCHPTPYDTLGIWGKGCQQGGCHSFYHEDSTTAHSEMKAPYDSLANNCETCHDQSSFAVTQNKCLNCHAAYLPGDLTPPVTTSNTQPEYYGPAAINFSITDNGKIGIGRTFYRLDGGPVTAAGNSLLVTTPGQHQLDFWSIDQSGNTESPPKTVTFSILSDTTPPTTTSNAQPTYYQGAVITLSATDTSSRGVKTTFYRLNNGPINGPIQTGTSVVIPATSGTIAYTLAFWSEDWAGNIETEKNVNFTVTSGTVTLRLIWGGSDVNGSPCPGDPDAEAAWSIGKMGSNTIIKSGGDGCPGWSGVNDVTVPASPTKHYILIDWWNSDIEDWDQTGFSNISVTTPGQVIRLNY